MGSVSPYLYISTPLYQAQPSAPTLYLIRRGQAEHNVNPSHLARRDTVLTETGRLQAAKLCAVLPDSLRRRISAVVASPLRRALLTALIGFEDLITLNKAKEIGSRVSDSAARIYSTTIDHFQSQIKPFRLVALPEA
jgi:phosphohistidine phosphatase SixA